MDTEERKERNFDTLTVVRALSLIIILRASALTTNFFLVIYIKICNFFRKQSDSTGSLENPLLFYEKDLS